MCRCKIHLHARWVIEAILKSSKKQKINLDDKFKDYKSFFTYLTHDCPEDEHAHISWQCTPDKKTACQHIISRWNTLKATLLESSDEVTTVKFNYFHKEKIITKKGKETKQLQLIKIPATLEFLIKFLNDNLFYIINHRNQLRHYHNVINTFLVLSIISQVYLDVDFSENLSVPVKYEPMSLYWGHEQVTVHLGILKVNGEKFYHPYLSDDRKHDQVLVRKVIQEMLDHEEFSEDVA